ncbi:MAG: helix-turn-helix transcriptional regulator [Planctomycetes bacterium]|nr:helix-turn-helix transcriptional regulator [Planctomycetota bacterium]
MATVDINFNLLEAIAPASLRSTIVAKRVKANSIAKPKRFSKDVDQADQTVNRIALVRQQQDMSLRSVARHTGVDVRTLRKQEKPTANLTLTELTNWANALDVPVKDLIDVPGQGLASPIKQRAQLIRIMKSAVSIQENADCESMQAFADTLVSQLVELMPELDGIAAWPTYGQRRGSEEVGRTAEQYMPVHAVGAAS